MRNSSFPRCIKPKNAVGNPPLVVSSDASKEAFGACAYAVWELEDGSHVSNLILAKSRLAPKRQTSIVQSELCGLLLAVRIKCFLFEHSRLKFDRINFIVNSEIVRAMTQKESYGFNVFTGLRLGEIQETEDPKDFFWVPGDLNIADLISRGSSPAELNLGSQWQSGPSFLKLAKQQWPLQQKQYSLSDLPDVLRNKKFSVQTKANEETIDYECDRFSSLASLIRTIARILLLKTRRSLKVLNQTLTSNNIDEAWDFIMKNEQRQIQQAFESGKFERLGAFRNEKGLIMAGRRINEIVPLLPKSSRLVNLAIKEAHQPCRKEVLATASKVRKKCWLPSLLKVIKYVLKFCTGYRLYNKEKASQSGMSRELTAVSDKWEYLGLRQKWEYKKFPTTQKYSHFCRKLLIHSCFSVSSLNFFLFETNLKDHLIP